MKTFVHTSIIWIIYLWQSSRSRINGSKTITIFMILEIYCQTAFPKNFAIYNTLYVWKYQFHHAFPCKGYFKVFANLLGKSCVVMVFICIYFIITEATFSILFTSSVSSFVSGLFDRAHPLHHKHTYIHMIWNSNVCGLPTHCGIHGGWRGRERHATSAVASEVSRMKFRILLLFYPEETMCPAHLLLSWPLLLG